MRSHTVVATSLVRERAWRAAGQGEEDEHGCMAGSREGDGGVLGREEEVERLSCGRGDASGSDGEVLSRQGDGEIREGAPTEEEPAMRLVWFG